MNNNMPNNNEKNNDLNAVSLGNINTGNINDITPVPPVENLDSQPLGNDLNSVGGSNNFNATPSNSIPSVESVPPVESINSIPSVEPVAPVSPVNYDIPETINSFNTTPVFNEIGTVPPISNGTSVTPPIMNPEEPKPKKKKNKLLFVIIIVLLIAAVGVGVYIFLNMSNKPAKISVKPKEVEIEAGSEVSDNIEDYATFSGINSANCSLDTSNITDTSVIDAEYSFTITCGSNTYNGTAKVVDKTAPVVVLKEVTAKVGEELKAEDFIDNCTDATKCSYAFSDEDAVKEYLNTAANYHVDIIVKDEAGNEVTVTGTLIVTEDDIPEMYLDCVKENETLRFGITSGSFTGSVIRFYVFTFDDEKTYNDLKEQNKDQKEITYQNITGTPSFNDDNYTLTVYVKVTREEIEKEFGKSLPNSYGELRSTYVNLGYECNLVQP